LLSRSHRHLGIGYIPFKGGARYFLTCYDDYLRKVHLSFLKKKLDAFSAIKSYIALVEQQLGTKVKALCSDNDDEFSSQGKGQLHAATWHPTHSSPS
jgi:uncharacterized protein (DUF427 family)